MFFLFITLFLVFYFLIFFTMRKSLLITALLWLSIFFVGCDKKWNQPANNNLPEPNDTYTQEVTDTEEVSDFAPSYPEPEEYIPEQIQEPEIEENVVPQYETNTHEEMTFEEIGAALAKCDELWREPVCGKDWGTYFNRCYLEFAGMEEDTAAEIVDGSCVFN